MNTPVPRCTDAGAGGGVRSSTHPEMGFLEGVLREFWDRDTLILHFTKQFDHHVSQLIQGL